MRRRCHLAAHPVAATGIDVQSKPTVWLLETALHPHGIGLGDASGTGSVDAVLDRSNGGAQGLRPLDNIEAYLNIREGGAE